MLSQQLSAWHYKAHQYCDTYMLYIRYRENYEQQRLQGPEHSCEPCTAKLSITMSGWFPSTPGDCTGQPSCKPASIIFDKKAFLNTLRSDISIESIPCAPAKPVNKRWQLHETTKNVSRTPMGKTWRLLLWEAVAPRNAPATRPTPDPGVSIMLSGTPVNKDFRVHRKMNLHSNSIIREQQVKAKNSTQILASITHRDPPAERTVRIGGSSEKALEGVRGERYRASTIPKQLNRRRSAFQEGMLLLSKEESAKQRSDRRVCDAHQLVLG
ncbi:putative galactinol--sucrose galactosyltransferase 2 [Senna tora]|uniref:Putative galactinol--sucrose galactosyltransferase 2 n=1 Tax=Senna tora TaxID=362788 RepID=A0A834WJ39_9FABA|nr:putative galactinol--sucrose galactosyltransferase 2 [Senna tora]